MFSNDLFLFLRCHYERHGPNGRHGRGAFSQEILQPNFSIDSILDAIEDMSLLHKIRVRKN